PSAVYGGAAGRFPASSVAGIWPVMTDIEVCSWPGTTVSIPRNSGRFLSALRYSISRYWNSWIDCHRHMFRFGLVPGTSPFGVTPEFSHDVVGPTPAGNGYAGVVSVASSTSVQLRLPFPPCPACTNQSSPHGVSTRSVAFLTSFCIEIEPSEHVVWLWKSPATYVPGIRAGAEHVTWTVDASAHAAAGSPSPTLRCSVTVPGVVQVKVGFLAAVSLSVPALD